MFNLQQQVSTLGDISRLSISSQPGKSQTKNPSFQNPSTLNSQGAVLSNDQSNLKTEKIKNLRIRMQEIVKVQEIMDIQMKTYISIIEKQVSKKQEQNTELESLINKLKEEIMESRQDLQVLQSYINKKAINVSNNDSRSIRSTSKTITSKSGSNLTKISKESGSENLSKKNIISSPQNKLDHFKMPENRSPTNRNDKKNSFSGNLVPSLQKITKSPFK